MNDIREEESLVEKDGTSKWIPASELGAHVAAGWTDTELVRTKLFPKANRPSA